MRGGVSTVPKFYYLPGNGYSSVSHIILYTFKNILNIAK